MYVLVWLEQNRAEAKRFVWDSQFIWEAIQGKLMREELVSGKGSGLQGKGMGSLYRPWNQASYPTVLLGNCVRQWEKNLRILPVKGQGKLSWFLLTLCMGRTFRKAHVTVQRWMRTHVGRTRNSLQLKIFSGICREFLLINT